MSFDVRLRWRGIGERDLENLHPFSNDPHDLAQALLDLAGSRWRRWRWRWAGHGELLDALALPTMPDDEVNWRDVAALRATIARMRKALLAGCPIVSKLAAGHESVDGTPEEALAQDLADLLTMLEQAQADGHDRVAIEVA